MKKAYYIFLFLSLQFASAQNQELKRANLLFQRTSYSDVIPLYENIITRNRSFDVIKNLADSYYYTGDYSNAQRYYRFLAANYIEALNEDYIFRFAQTLKATSDYEESNSLMRDFLLKANNNIGLAQFEKDLKNLENIAAIGNRFEIKNQPFNTTNSEFGGIRLGNYLVFSGISNKTSLFNKMYNWNNQPYLDLLKVSVNESANNSNTVDDFSDELNSEMHEANAVFTKDGKTIYFTRNNNKRTVDDKNKYKVSKLKIFKAELVNGKWSNIVALPFNSDAYSCEHPALSTDEKTLYFASDMPGTFGSFDIFKVAINGIGYGIPHNLGQAVNTKRKEQFPFVSKDNKLYFSSDGHAGYGFMDVFVSEIEKDSFTAAVNIGLPVNSSYDDFSYSIDSDAKVGFVSSNRPGGKGNDDIYAVKEIKPLLIENCGQTISGIISDVNTNMPIPNATVSLVESEKTELKNAVTSADGRFTFAADCDITVTVVASKEGFNTVSRVLLINKERKKSNDASMQLKSELAVIKEAELAIKAMKDKEEAQIKEEKLIKQSTAKKEIEAAALKKRQRVETLLASEKDVVKDKERLIIKTDPIYFDYNLYYIRRDSKMNLNRVIELMKKYPEMVIEIGSHTDNRGDAKFNEKLSSNRAASTREYFIGQGISGTRIYAKGYGETIQIVKCEPSDTCTEEQHELNRRSEFVIRDL